MVRVLTIFFVTVANVAWSQDYSYIHYSVPEGLPSAEVYQCYQDKSGFMWFATDNGVARFDGKEIQAFHSKEGLPDPVIFGFHEDQKGRLWFRSYSGRLSWFENDTIHKFAYNDTLAPLLRKSILHSMYVDSYDRLWLGAGEFAGSISANGKINFSPVQARSLYFNEIDDGFIYGSYWPSSLVDAVNINGKAFAIENADKNYDNQTVNAVRWNRSIFVSIANSVFKFDGKSLTRVLRVKDHVLSLSVDLENKLWVGFRTMGVQRFCDDQFKEPLTLKFLEGKSVSKVLEDDQHGFWISTLQSGVYYIPNFSLLDHPLPAGPKIVAARGYGDKTILGDESGVIRLMDNKTGNEVARNALPGRSLFSIFVDSEKNIWASTILSGYLLDPGLRLKKKLQIDIDLFQRQDTVFGLSRLRVLKYSLDAQKLAEKKLPTIQRSMLDCHPYVLLSSRTGLDVFDSQFNFIRTLESFRNFKVSKLMGLSDSVVLVATIGSGYFLLQKNSWKIIGRSEGERFIGDNVYTALLLDSAVWLGTEKGIAITPVSALIRNHPDFTFMDRHSGLMSDKVNLLIYAAPNVWAFSDQGFTIIPPRLAKVTPPAPRFYLKKILINNQQIDLLAERDLPFLKNNLEINFGFVGFKNQHISLRSRLSQNGQWHYSEDRHLKFYSLAPGNYRFQLQYSLDREHWINAFDEINFTIEQPWWRTSWFQAIIIAVIILVLYAIFGSQMTVLRHRNEKLNVQNENKKSLLQAEIETLERERSRIAKDLHDGVGMNLTVLKLHLHELLKKNQSADSALVEEQLKATIQEIRAIVHNLTPSGIALFGLAEAVKDYIDRAAGHLGINIELFSTGKKVMDPKISLFTFRILQELLSNSLKHSDATRITIRIRSTDNTLNIVFEDNGVGFDKSVVKYGAGLMNIQSRLEAMNGTLAFTSVDGVLYILNIPLPEEQTKSVVDPVLGSLT